MRHLLAPFIWIDALIQKCVDQIVFFLMRQFGLRKSVLRYWLNGFLVFGGMIFITIAFPKGDIIEMFAFSVLVAFFLFEQHREYREDQRAEKAGMVSMSDLNYIKMGIICKPIGYIILLGYNFSVTQLNMGALELFSSNMIVSVSLLLFYLAKTPNTSPPKEK